MKSLLTLMIVCSYFIAAGQEHLPARDHLFDLHRAPYSSYDRNIRAKTTSNVFDTTGWAASVDAYWGNGLPTANKLSIFDTFWHEVDSSYPCFVQLPLYNWDSIVNAKRNEIGMGVSKGRFAGIISDLMTYINDAHSNFIDVPVSYYTNIAPGLPVFRGQSGRFGACVAALDDSSALVCEVVPNHPFGLQPGDIILGYNSIAWKELVKIILRHQLPNSVFKGSTSWATWQRYIKAAGENWYLFDTINIRKCNGTLVSYPTSLMVGNSYPNFCPDQLPVPGVSRLSYQDLQANKAYSSGVITGTSIGYVYMYDCLDMSGDSLYNRVKTLVEDSLVTGLMIDIRTNFGGSLNAFAKTFEYLNNGNASWLGYGERNDPSNRYSMINTGSPLYYDINDTDPHSFSGPVALLTGPEAVSAGDLLPVLFSHCSQVRTFGRSTGGAFGAYKTMSSGSADYIMSRQQANFFEPSNPNYYLTHTEYPVDHTTWMTQSSVCAGTDNVVDEAKAWIWQLTGLPNTTTTVPEVAVYPVPSSGGITVRIRAVKNETVRLAVTDLSGRTIYKDSRSLSAGTQLIPVQKDLNPGCYLLEVSGSFGAISRKIVIR